MTKFLLSFAISTLDANLGRKALQAPHHVFHISNISGFPVADASAKPSGKLFHDIVEPQVA